MWSRKREPTEIWTLKGATKKQSHVNTFPTDALGKLAKGAEVARLPCSVP
jgi:hypothetical protein